MTRVEKIEAKRSLKTKKFFPEKTSDSVILQTTRIKEKSFQLYHNRNW